MAIKPRSPFLLLSKPDHTWGVVNTEDGPRRPPRKQARPPLSPHLAVMMDHEGIEVVFGDCRQKYSSLRKACVDTGGPAGARRHWRCD
jgi:hypothetical protein